MAKVPCGHSRAGQTHPRPRRRWNPHPECISVLGALPGGSSPQRGLHCTMGGAGRAKIKSKLRESMARSRGRPPRLPCDFDSPIITPN